MKVAVAQLEPTDDRSTNVEETIRLLRGAIRQGTDLIVLPELCTSPYQLAEEELDAWAEEIPSGEIIQSWLSEIRVSNSCLIAGLLEKSGDSYYNSALVLDPTGLVGIYRKAHLFGWEKRRLTAGGDPFFCAQVGSFRLGVLICYDLRFIEAVRLLALQKAQLLCVPAAWTDTGKPQAIDHTGFCGAAHLALGHAYASAMFVLCAGRSGREGELRYLGNSLIAAPGGVILAGPATPQYRGMLSATIKPEQAENKSLGKCNDLFEDRRTDLYSLHSTEKVAITTQDPKSANIE